MKGKVQSQQNVKSKNRSKNILTIVAISVLALTLMAVAIGYFINTNRMNTFAVSLEDIYNRSFYELVDNVNNTEIKMSKLMASSDKVYQSKILKEIKENTNSAQNNVSILPLSMGGIDDSVKFINQLNGYLTSLENNVETNGLTNKQKTTLNDLYDSVVDMKYNLNVLTKKMQNGYSILDFSYNINNDGMNNFTTDMKNIKSVDVDYPTLIYDGPFADSELNKIVKGLNFDNISENVARDLIQDQIFAGKTISQLENVGEIESKFSTYNFRCRVDGYDYYVQTTKKGGKLLTLSCNNDMKTINFSLIQAQDIALDFVKNLGLSDMEVVWSDIIGGDAFINLTPTKNNIILYPDLIKVKVDLSKGIVIGYEASAYYTNHTKNRNLPNALLSVTEAQTKIDTMFNLQTHKLVLAPLEYSREVLCYEFKCEYNNAIYYIYINALTGAEENILKIIETDNGRLLM